MKTYARFLLVFLTFIIIPCSLSAQPQQVETLYPYWHGLWKLAVDDDILAIAAGWEGCVFLDVSDPQNPVHLDRYHADVIIADVIPLGNSWIISNRDGVDVVSYDGSSEPICLGEFGVSDGLTNASSVYENLFASAYWFAPGIAECSIYDISNPLNPTAVSSIRLNHIPTDLFLDNENIYIGFSDQVRMYSYQEDEFTLLDTIDFEESNNLSFTVNDSILTVAASNLGLFQYIKTPENSLELSWYHEIELNYPDIIEWSDNHFCLIDQYIRMVEVSENEITILDSLSLNQPHAPESIVKVGNSLYAGFDSLSNEAFGYIVIINWENGQFSQDEIYDNPGIINTFTNDESILAAMVNSSRIDLIDLLDPLNPNHLSSIEFDTLYPNVAFKNGYLIVAEPNIGFHIIDCSNLSHPVENSIVPYPEEWNEPRVGTNLDEFLTFDFQGNFAIFSFFTNFEISGRVTDLVLIDIMDTFNPQVYFWRNANPPRNLNMLATVHPDGEHIVIIYENYTSNYDQAVLLATINDSEDIEIVNTEIQDFAFTINSTNWIENYLIVSGQFWSGTPNTAVYNLDNINNINLTDRISNIGGMYSDTFESSVISLGGYENLTKFNLNQDGIIADTASFTTPTTTLGGLACFPEQNLIAVNHGSNIILYSGIENWLDVEDDEYQINNRPSIPDIMLSTYPNPFNSSTTISCNLPVSGFYTLDIYNILAQKVATIHSGYLKEGIHDFVWNMSTYNEFSSGAYYVVLNGEKQFISKIQYLK